MKNLFFVLFFFGLISGCKSQKNQTMYVETRALEQPIIGGVNLTKSNPIASFTVGLFDSKNEFICTGSLISSNTILTAAHCIESEILSNPQDLIIVFSIDMSALDNPNKNGNSQVLRKASSVEQHPAFKPSNTAILDWDDIALVTFNGPLPEGYAPIQILENIDSLERGTKVFMAGYGASRVETEEVIKRDKKFKKDLATGDVICNDSKLTYCFRVEFFGSDLLRSTTGVIEGFTEKEIRLNESSGQGTCVGDSGGPLLVFLEDRYNLIGVTSRGSEFCDGPAVYTNATEYHNWIFK